VHPTPVSTAPRLAESPIDEAFVEAELAAVFDQTPGVAHDPLEDAIGHPLFEPPMYRALRSILFGQIFPLCPIVENPENTAQRVPFVRSRTAALGATRHIRNALHEPVELAIG
jgi:hypothetical protein